MSEESSIIVQCRKKDSFINGFKRNNKRNKEGHTTQTFIFNNIKNERLHPVPNNLSKYFEYYGYASNNDAIYSRKCSNHRSQNTNAPCHSYFIIHTKHGIRLKHCDKVLKKNIRPKGPVLPNNSRENIIGRKEILQKTTFKNDLNAVDAANVVGKSTEAKELLILLKKKIVNTQKSNALNGILNKFDEMKNFQQHLITDNDIVFGNGRLVLRKHNYGWERSRIEWLFELERTFNHS